MAQGDKILQPVLSTLGSKKDVVMFHGRITADNAPLISFIPPACKAFCRPCHSIETVYAFSLLPFAHHPRFLAGCQCIYTKVLGFGNQLVN